MQHSGGNAQTEPQIQMAFPPAPPVLQVHWQPWWPHFLNNIADLFRPSPPQVKSTSRPADFWPDVFVSRPLPWKNFGQSAFFHSAAILFVLTTGRFWLFSHQTVVEDPYQNTTLTYYKVDDLLPAVKLNSPPAPHQKSAQKGQPEFALQEIISVPAAVDNSTQSIVNPPHPEILRKEVPLPNIVVSTPSPAPPIVALSKSQITFPVVSVTPVQPAPDVEATNQPRSKLSDVPAPAVVQPAISADATKRKLDEIKIAQSQLDPKVEAPKLELPAQTAAVPPQKEESLPPPPAPSTERLRGGQRSAGQLLALSLHPSPPATEIKIPDASRAGIFAASPAGKAGAPGIPQIAAEKSAETSEAAGTGKAQGAGGDSESPIGISIGGPRMKAGTAAIVSGPSALPPPNRQANTQQSQSNDKKKLMAAAAPPSFADIARRQVPPYSPPPLERKPEDQVFAGKKYYSMQLNMPNLTSAGGSWIIRFAELKQDFQAGELSTPVATSKVDPAYPADLIHDHVEGTVILYAIIHADGTVGDVRVLQGFHEKLDENARIALTRWHFRPAMKNGLPVELEAVVQIPFKTRKSGF